MASRIHNVGARRPNWAVCQICVPNSLVCRSVLQGKTSPASQSEKRYGFSTLYICVRDRRADEFWEGTKWVSHFAGVERRVARRPCLNGSNNHTSDKTCEFMTLSL